MSAKKLRGDLQKEVREGKKKKSTERGSQGRDFESVKRGENFFLGGGELREDHTYENA